MPEDPTSSTSGQPTPLDFSIQNEFSNYQEIPSKGYCRIFKAQRHGKWCVLKGLQPQHRADPLYMAMLEKEYHSAVRMDHPNIVRTIGIENDPVVGPCLVMDYVEGRTLAQFLGDNPSRSLRKKVIFQLLDAMRYYHALQIVHRDLKPSNILITVNGNNVKVIDFGLADADDYAILKEPAYTKGYAALEQMVSGAPVDCRTDIYAFGVLLRQLFPHRYRYISHRCTEEKPDKRYPDAASVKQALLRSDRWLMALPALVVLVLLAALWLVVLSLSRPVESDSQQQSSVEASDHEVSSATQKPQDKAVLAQSDTVMSSAPIRPSATASPTPKETAYNMKQIKVLLQNASDSMLADFRKSLDRGEYLSSLSAGQHGVKIDYCLQRYFYYLLASFSASVSQMQYFELSRILVNTSDKAKQLVDASGLPSYGKYDIPPECKTQEDAIIAETEAMLPELMKLNMLYINREFDSILQYTEHEFPPIKHNQ